MQNNKNRFRFQDSENKANKRAGKERPSRQNYPEGPNEKQGYPDPDGEKPNSDDLHTEQNIENDSPKKGSSKENARKKKGQKNYYGWEVSIRDTT